MILALRALGLGDLLTAVPAIRALQRIGAPLTLAVPRSLHEIVAWAGLAERTVDVASAVDAPPRPLAAPGPVQLAVNLHGQGPQSTDVLRRLGPDQLWAYDTPGAPAWDPGEHEVRRWCRLVEHHGCRTDPADLFLAPDSGAGDGVLLHPGANGPLRRWPADRFAVVARALALRGERVTVTAGRGEEGLAATVVAAADHKAVTMVDGLSLVGLAEQVGRSALVISSDTGVAHLATALCRPSVVVFGPVPPSRWGPPPLPRHRALWRPTTDSDASITPDGPHPSLLRVSVADVLDAAAAVRAAGSDADRGGSGSSQRPNPPRSAPTRSPGA